MQESAGANLEEKSHLLTRKRGMKLSLTRTNTIAAKHGKKTTMMATLFVLHMRHLESKALNHPEPYLVSAPVKQSTWLRAGNSLSPHTLFGIARGHWTETTAAKREIDRER